MRAYYSRNCDRRGIHMSNDENITVSDINVHYYVSIIKHCIVLYCIMRGQYVKIEQNRRRNNGQLRRRENIKNYFQYFTSYVHGVDGKPKRL